MRPVFCEFYGTIKGRRVKYTAVLVPHFLERMVERGNRIGSEHFRSLIPKFWNVAITNKLCGTKVGSAYIYFKRKFDRKRKRWELVFITITPDFKFNTKKFSDAIEVKL